MSRRPTEQETLELANALIDAGVPVVVCRPRQVEREEGTVMEAVPILDTWTHVDPEDCRALLRKFRYGKDALLMVGGHGIDIIDVDTKKGKDGSIDGMPAFTDYGITGTPSGGVHYVVPSTWLGSKLNLTVGGRYVGDYIGGKRDGSSRRGAFLPGSVRPKYRDTMYEFKADWDVAACVRNRLEDKARDALVAAGLNDEVKDPFATGGEDLSEPWVKTKERPYHPYFAAALAGEIGKLVEEEMIGWGGNGWDTTTFEVACKMARWAHAGWTGYSEEDALEDLLRFAPQDNAGFGPETIVRKWEGALKATEGQYLLSPDDPRREMSPIEDDDPVMDGIRNPDNEVDVTNKGETADWMRRMIGREGSPLAGLFLRDGDLVYTPRIGEEGYEPPKGPRDQDGPAQIRRMDATRLAAYIDSKYFVHSVKRLKAGNMAKPRELFPIEVAARAAATPDQLQVLRPLSSVSHTPVVRPDWTVWKTPGYDIESQTLYLPDRGLVVPDEDDGWEWLRDELLEGFPWEPTEGDPNGLRYQANYLGALLTPLLRRVAPPPYPMFAFTAPQPGSGKSLLTHVLRIIHGGVLRAEMSRDKEELRKQITSILLSTSAPVVTFDNMAGTLKSPTLDSLLTGRTYTDRALGSNEDKVMTNDRLWTITGNNLDLGGDLKRRTVWVSIDPNTPEPEKRTGFKHNDLPGWTEENRGRVIAALLGMVRRWVEDGSEMIPLARTDDYGVWQQTVGSILSHAGVPGAFNHDKSIKESGLEDEEEWARFVRAVSQAFGTREWRVRDVLDGLDFGEGVTADDLPAHVSTLLSRSPVAANQSLGKWIKGRGGRWTRDGLAIRPGGSTGGATRWHVVSNID